MDADVKSEVSAAINSQDEMLNFNINKHGINIMSTDNQTNDTLIAWMHVCMQL